MLDVTTIIKKFTVLVKNYYPHIILVLFFCFKLLPQFDKSSSVLIQRFNYLDSHLFFEALERFSYGDIIYKDFYWEYGFLYLLISLPLYVLAGKTFFISNLIAWFLIPVISAIISFVIGYLLFSKNKSFFFIFLLLQLSYGTGLDFTSLRHLIPELGLLLLVLGIEKKHNKYIYSGFVLFGLSLISSLEYGAIIFICALFYFAIKYFIDKVNLVCCFPAIIKGFILSTVISFPRDCR